MMLTPIVSALFMPVSNYALKLIIDHLAVNQNFTISDIIFPITLFCLAVFVAQMIWRVYKLWRLQIATFYRSQYYKQILLNAS